MINGDSVCAAISLIVVWFGLTLGSSSAAAQNLGVETGGHVIILRLTELDVSHVGVGAHVIWPFTSVVAIDGAFTWFPGSGDFEANALLESQHRTLGLVGFRASVAKGDVEFFARARVGFLRFGEQDSAVCIAIFPIPLGCRLATGYTAFASDFGGGASVGLGSSGPRRVNIESGDLLVRYGLEALRPRGEITDGFVGHNPGVSIGLGWRF
jgi:hypothetical protein